MAEDTHVERFVADTRGYSEPLKRAAGDADHFGDRNDKAALAARRMGLAASEAAQKAARAQKEAADAAEKLGRSELGADEAARKAAAALNAVERASIKQAEAMRAAGKAADEEAANLHQLGRAATETAALEELGRLRASKSVKEHNSLLERMRGEYKGFGKDLKEMETLGDQSMGALKAALSGVVGVAGSVATSLGPGMVAAIGVGLAVLPAAATLIGGAIDVGIGGALAGIGLKATMGTATAQHALTGLKEYASGVMHDISKPFEQTWVNIATSAKTALGGIAPELKSDFAAIAPAVSGMVNQIGHELPAEMHGFLSAIQADFPPIAAELGQTLPHALGLAADGLKQIMDEVGRNPQEFGDMINATGRLVQALGTMVTYAIKAGEAMTELNRMDGEFGTALQNAGAKLGIFGGSLSATGGLLKRFDMSSGNAGNTLVMFAGNMVTAAASAGKLSDATAQVDLSMKELSKTLSAYLDPQIAVFNDTTQLRREFIALGAAMKTAKGDLSGTTEASRKARDAFEETLKTTSDLAEQTYKMTGSAKAAGSAIKPMIDRLWALAGNSKTAQREVETLATLFGVPLPAAAGKGKRAIDSVHSAMGQLKSKQITVTADVSQAVNAARNLQSIINSIVGGHANGGAIMPPILRAEGGAIGLADGGQARRMPNGGGVWGAGTSKSDDIPVWASTGEYMVKAVSYAANKGLVEAINAANGRPVQLGGQKSGSTLGTGQKDAVLHAMPLARRHYAETLTGGTGGSTRPVVQNHNYYIAGSVWSEQELLNTLQRVAFERGIDFNRPAGR